MTEANLRRTLGLPSMVFFGVGTIVGAGIYVLVGEVAGQAGVYAPASFLLAAVVATFTGLSYSELVARFPVSAGEGVYVDAAFGRKWLSVGVAGAVVFTGLVSASTLTRGFAGYAQELRDLPAWLWMTGLVVAVTALAVAGVQQSVLAAVVITCIEVGGLLLVVIASSDKWIDGSGGATGTADVSWAGVAAGAFLAFYAFIGFEDMVNMAEEVRDAPRTLPRAVLWALVVATALYLLVAVVAVRSVATAELADSSAPLALLASGTWVNPLVIPIISMIAITNGVVVQFLMAPRVVYGMSRIEPSLAPLARLSRSQTPAVATALFGALVLVFALALPVERLAQLTSATILVVFSLVNVALIRLRSQPHTGFRAPRAVPYLGLLSALGLLLAQFAL